MSKTNESQLAVWLYGEYIGSLGRTFPEFNRDLSFSYDSPACRPFSVSFTNPNIYEEAALHSGQALYQWFNNLLPEGASRQMFIRNARANQEDVFRILFGNANAEYIGAIQFCKPEPEQHYRLIEPGQKRLSLLAGQEFKTGIRSQPVRAISLSGATSKTGITIDREGNWFHPESHGSLSTHILKINPAILHNSGFEIIEVCSQNALSNIGVDAAGTQLEILDDTQVILSRRFDRQVAGAGPLQVTAIHQEELMAAAGGDPDDRHMHDDAPGHWADTVGYPKLAGLLRQFSKDAERELVKLVRLVAATFLLGDSDKHPKNISLLHTRPPDAFSVKLAPAYDTASAYCLEEMGYSQHQAIPIGREYLRPRIGTRAIKDFAKSIGLDRELVDLEFQDVARSLPDAFMDASTAALETQPVLRMDKARRNVEITLSEINKQCGRLLTSYRRRRSDKSIIESDCPRG